MIYHIIPEQCGFELSWSGHNIPPEVPGENSSKQIGCSGQYQEPGSQKVQAPPPAILIEYVVGPVRADWRGLIVEERCGLVPATVLVVSTDWQLDERRGQVVSHLAPVESGMNHQNQEAGECKREKAHCEDPVRRFNPVGMPHSI